MAKKKVVTRVTETIEETKTTKKTKKKRKSPAKKKKKTKRKTASKKTAKKRVTKATIDQQLLENLIELQKVNVNMSEKFDLLSRQISDLLDLFESAARNFASNPKVQSSEKDKDFLEKIDKLLDQNKTIAKGLTLMEQGIRDRVYGKHPEDKMKESMSTKEEKKDFGDYMGSRPLPRF